MKAHFTAAELAALDETTRAMVLRGQASANKTPDPSNRKGELGPLAEHILKVMDDNPTVTKPAQIIALAELADPKIIKGKSGDALRKAVLRARTHRGLSRA
ncbi:MAG: hypothetical protein ACLPTF_19630 [Steroidobacteraceae bacterium]